MQRHDAVLDVPDAQSLPLGWIVERGAVRQQGVDHRIADEVDAPIVDTHRRQMIGRLGTRREEQVRKQVADEPVDLLRHRPVERAEPGFDVGARDVQLGRREAASERAVHVAVQHHQARAIRGELLLETHHRRRGLLGMRPRPDPEVHIRHG